VAVLEAGLQQAPVLRRVAGAVALDGGRLFRGQIAGGVAPHQFGTLARVAEEDRSDALPGELGSQVSGLGVGAATPIAALVERSGPPHDELPRSAGGVVVVDDGETAPAEAGG